MCGKRDVEDKRSTKHFPDMAYTAGAGNAWFKSGKEGVVRVLRMGHIWRVCGTRGCGTHLEDVRD